MRNRLFLAVASTMFVDSLLYLAIVPLLPWYAEHFHLGRVGAAVLLAAYPVTFLVVTAPAGWLASRLGARRIVIAGTCCFIVATVLFAWAPTPAVVIIARLLQGAGGGINWGAAMAWLTGNTPRERRSRTTGAISGVLAAGAVCGPILGALAGATSPTIVFGLVSVLAAIALVLSIATPEGVEMPRDPALHSTLGRLLRHPLVLCSLAFSLADAVGVAAVDLLAPLALGANGVSPTAIGIAIAGGAGLGVIASQIAGRLGERLGSFPVALVGGLGMGVVPALLVLPLPDWAVLALLVALGPFFPILMTGIFPLMSAAADDLGLSHGTANALPNMVWSAGFAVAPLLVAPLADVAGDPTAYAVIALTVFGLLAIAVLMRSRARNLSLSH